MPEHWITVTQKSESTRPKHMTKLPDSERTVSALLESLISVTQKTESTRPKYMTN